MGKRLLEDDPVLKSEKKREKKSRKDALKFEDITPPATDSSHTPASELEPDEEYPQRHELTQISQDKIHIFLTKNSIRIADPQPSFLCPILSFAQLPPEIASQYGRVFEKFSKPSTIQSTAWPFLLSGRDVVGVAETGSGKTLAFGLPLVVLLANLKKTKGVRAAVIAPT